MPNVTAAAPTGRPEIDALFFGVKWATTTLTYGFTTSASQYEANYPGNYLQTYSPLGAAGQAAMVRALAEWSDVSNVTFTRAASPAAADIRIGASSSVGTAEAFLPSNSPVGGDVWLGTRAATSQTPEGSYAYATLIHELGHALGFQHPHEGANPGITDQLAYSVMSYRSYPGGPVEGSYSNVGNSFPSSPMLSDIAAIQALYGANFATRAGDDTYTWTPGGKVFETVWDGGGRDTYNLSAFTSNLSVDLAPGAWTYFGTPRELADLGNGQFPPGNVANAWLYNNDARSLIENAVGGSGNDVLRGNAAGNALSGMGGDDTLYGFDGNDVLDAGTGSATAFGGAGSDTLVAQLTAGNNLQFYGGSAQADPLDAADSIQVTGVGTNGLARIYANGGDDLVSVSLSGNARVEIYGGMGGDTIRVTAPDAGASTFIAAGAGSDRLVLALGGAATVFGGDLSTDPNDAADFIDASASTGRLLVYGNGGNDTIIGGAGDDTIFGGRGTDAIAGFGGRDVLIGGEGEGDFYVFSPADSTLAQTDEIVGLEAIDRIDLAVAGSATNAVTLQAAVADIGAALNAAAGAFANGAVFVAVQNAAQAWLFGDFDGNRAADFAVKLTGLTAAFDGAAEII